MIFVSFLSKNSMTSQRQLDEVKAAIAAIQLEIAAANEERKIAKVRLDKAITEGRPTAPFEKLLESATAELTRLGQEKDRLMEKENILTGDRGIKSIPFAAAKAQEIAEITGVNIHSKPYPPFTLDESVNPSDDFMAQLRKNNKVWSLNSEASRRTIIDLFLRDVVSRDEFNKMRIFCELNMTAVEANRKRKLNGDIDYTIGHAGNMPLDEYSPPKDSHLIVFEAKKDWPNDSVWQCVAEAATLHKIRKDKKKSNPRVWGILSNANNWKFIHIDNDGQLFVSDQYVLQIPTVWSEGEICTIYRIIHHIVLQSYLSSPTTTPNQSTEALDDTPMEEY
jgi:hypothetical protein